MSLRKFSILFSALAAWSTPLQAQSRAEFTVEAEVVEVLSLEMDRAQASFGPLAPEEPRVYEVPQATTLTVRANISWIITVTTPSDLHSETGIISIDFLEIRARPWEAGTGSGDYFPLSKTTGLTLYQGGMTPARGLRLVCDLRLKPGWSAPAGTYRVPISFSISPKQ